LASEAEDGVIQADKISCSAPTAATSFSIPSLDAIPADAECAGLTCRFSPRLRTSVLPGGHSLADLELDIFSVASRKSGW
jgi:hypothetical protein